MGSQLPPLRVKNSKFSIGLIKSNHRKRCSTPLTGNPGFRFSFPSFFIRVHSNHYTVDRSDSLSHEKLSTPFHQKPNLIKL